MKYYIMYENASDYELTVVTRDSPQNVVAFIEDKLNKHAYRLDEFKVIEGTELGLRTVKTPIKVLLTNQS